MTSSTTGSIITSLSRVGFTERTNDSTFRVYCKLTGSLVERLAKEDVLRRTLNRLSDGLWVPLKNGDSVLSKTLQQRIRARRKDFGITIADMAKLSGLASERWRSIESGESLSVAELGKVARALAVDAGTFLRGEEKSARRSVARFRKAADSMESPKRAEIRILALAAELGRIGGGLHRLLGREIPLQQLRKTTPVSGREEAWRDGYRLGEQTRRSLGIPGGPIVDLRSTLESLGVHIACLPFAESSIDAASFMEEKALPTILLNERSPRVEQVLPRRTALAHELCHLLHDAGEHDLATHLSGQSDSHIDDDIERRARAFAPAFLAPPNEVRLWFRSGAGRRWTQPRDKALALAKRWGLSWGGAVWHAKNCGLIRSATAHRLQTDTANQSDWHLSFEQSTDRSNATVQDVEVAPLCQGYLAEVVSDALEAGVISQGRAHEILTWS